HFGDLVGISSALAAFGTLWYVGGRVWINISEAEPVSLRQLYRPFIIGVAGGGDLSKWEALSGEADSGFLSGVSNRLKFEMAKTSYNLKSSIRIWLNEILEVLFESAALCINTVRTFYLIILAILGPLAFALSVYPGLEG